MPRNVDAVSSASAKHQGSLLVAICEYKGMYRRNGKEDGSYSSIVWVCGGGTRQNYILVENAHDKAKQTDSIMGTLVPPK